MKLKKYNRSFKQRTLKSAQVRIGQNGTFAFNRKAKELLGISAGKLINILQDEESPRDWYLQLTTEKTGIKVRGYKNGCICGASVAAHALFETLGVPNTEKSIALPIGAQPIDNELFAIITSAYSNPVNQL